jgi:hypothetical protein
MKSLGCVLTLTFSERIAYQGYDYINRYFTKAGFSGTLR